MTLDTLRKAFFHLRHSGLKGLIKYIKLNKFENRIFNDKELKWNDLGYWEMQPKPTDQELNKFYNEIYWLNNKFYKNNLLISRDIEHFLFIKDKISDKIIPNSVFLNYGAGHGGISYLANAAKMEVINIEPAGVFKGKINQFFNYQTLDEYLNKEEKQKKIDVLYSSHTIEHLNDPIKFFKKILPIMDDEGKIILEVPNCRIKNPDNNYHEGGCNGKITGSHVLYFTKDFFEKITDQIHFYSNIKIIGESIEVYNEDEADCIRIIIGTNEMKKFINQYF